MHAPATAAGTGGHFVQEHYVAAPFSHPHHVRRKPRQSAGQPRQLVEMRGEDRAAAHLAVQSFQHRPGDGQTVQRCRAAADFIDDHQAAWAGLV